MLEAFSKGDSWSAHKKSFCLTVSMSLAGWHFIKLAKRFVQQLGELFSWIRSVKLQFEAWPNAAQPQGREFTRRKEVWKIAWSSHQTGLVSVMASACSQPPNRLENQIEPYSNHQATNDESSQHKDLVFPGDNCSHQKQYYRLTTCEWLLLASRITSPV